MDQSERSNPSQFKELSEEEMLIQANLDVMATGIFACQTHEEVDVAISFANFLSGIGLTRANYPLFLRLIGTNNPWVVDALIGKREPRLLFASIPPSDYLIRKALQVLSFFHTDIIYEKTLESTLGIVETAYYDPDDGYGIYRLKVSDLNTLGKYLDKKEDQDSTINRLVLAILDRLSSLGDYNKEHAKFVLARHAYNIRFAYFDHLKRLEDVIPQVLLYNALRKDKVVGPSKFFTNPLKTRDPMDKTEK